MLSRRDFLQASSIVSLSPMLPSVFTKTAHAAGARADSRTLVVVQLDGGKRPRVCPRASGVCCLSKDTRQHGGK